MEIVTAIVTPVVESLMVPVKKHLGYLIYCTKYVTDMGTKMHQLEAKRLAVENHMNHNKSNNLEVPTEVRGWLEQVAEIDAQVKSIPSDIGSCFNIKLRHKLGRRAFKISEKIDRAIEESSTINWTNHQIPLGKVGSMKASTSTPSGRHNDFKSRERTFMEALKALQPDNKSQMIALCGMGGVGKTTMMEKMKKVVAEKKIFDFIVEAAIGEKSDPIVIQQSVADFLGVDLKESTKAARAIKLQKSFETRSDGGKKKILVILDDVWELVDLKDIGLSPLPNQGIGFKFLLTSRNLSVCTMMGVEVNSIFKVDVIEDPEAQNFFQGFVQLASDDHELHKIGEGIVRKCCGLPIAIKTIARTLKGKSKDAWKDALSRLEHHDINEVVLKVFEISYKNLQDEETKSFFLLCGLFSEDFDIPVEDLVRYGWGLELFNNVYSIAEARIRLSTCIERLIHANLLIQSRDVGCVKMHDLVREFVLDMCSKGEHMTIVGDTSNWHAKLKSDSCKRISLTCTNMFELPRNFKFPNLSLLKLMHGDESLKFPENFNEDMKQLQVIAYDKMKYPLLFRSFQCSTNLRTLCLHGCVLMFDWSSIGDLLNLEVLSFSHCSIRKLPSIIGKLKKLRILDLTGCNGCLQIDEGVLKNLVELEELYMRTSKSFFDSKKKGNRFPHAISDELVERSKNLTSLEIEFFHKSDLPKNMSFKKLERFKISLGCPLKENDGQDIHSFTNTLMLVTNKRELLDSRMDVLFEKTEVLHLQVDGMNDIGEILVESSHHPQSSFYNLRVLHICKCANLRYLFTVDVANGLKKLEHLTISNCLVLETLVDCENSGVKAIKFQALKFLSLCELPKLMSLCNVVSVIELPQLEELILDHLPNFTSIYAAGDISAMQPLLNKEVVISQLKTLKIRNMNKLKEIWASEFGSSEEVRFSILREISVEGCDSLVNLFPSNPMALVSHLEYLEVKYCNSIDVIFNIDLGRVGVIEEASIFLERIQLLGLGKLKEVWRIKGVNKSRLLICCGLQGALYLEIEYCRRFRNIFVLAISDGGESGRNNELIKTTQEQEIDVISNEEIKEVGDAISNVVVPSYLIHSTVQNFRTIYIERCKEVEVVFEIESPSSQELTTTQNNQQPLVGIRLKYMECMSHVWKCNWNKFLVPQKQQLGESSSSFHNLTTIYLKNCHNIKYLFSPLMAKLLSNLKSVQIISCDVIEEVVSSRDDEDEGMVASTYTDLFPHLEKLELRNLPNLKRIGGGGGAKETSFAITTSIHDEFQFSQVDAVPWCLCQYFRYIYVRSCNSLSSVIPSYALGQMQKLEELVIRYCNSVVEVFETQGGCCSTNIDEGSGGTNTTLAIPRRKDIDVPQLSNLTRLKIIFCDRLEHVFTFSALESLMQLQELIITDCKEMKVIVKEEHGDQATMTSTKVVVFPRLKSIELRGLPNLTGFFLWKNEFRWPLLDDVKVIDCPQMMVFTSGLSISPELNYIHTSLGKFSLECGLNNLNFQDSTSSCLDTLEGFNWRFHDLIEIKVTENGDVKKIIPSNELLQLQKLEKISVTYCGLVEEVFEALEGTDSSELQSVNVVEISKLREVELKGLKNLKYIWKNNPWMVLEFPNLTKLSIDRCNSLEHVFTSSMVGSLLQLQELHIMSCEKIKVIVKKGNDVVEEDECDGKVNEILTFPRLKSLTLQRLPSLEGFCLGNDAFSWPLLDTLKIYQCPTIRVFTKGESTTPELKVIDTYVRNCYVGDDLNSFIKTKHEKGLKLYEDEDDDDV